MLWLPNYEERLLLLLYMYSVFSPMSVWRMKAYCMGKEGYAATQGNWEWNSEFYKEEELEENSVYSFKPIEDVKLWSTE